MAFSRLLASSLVFSASEFLWPERCVGCELPGALLCDDCARELPWISQQLACPVCGAPFGHLACTECGRHAGDLWETRSTVCSLAFGALAARLTVLYKDSHELRLAPLIAALMAASLDEASSWLALDGQPRYEEAFLDGICFVPASPKAISRRGFDHMALVASELSVMLGLPVADVLARDDARDQRDLGRDERQRNLCQTMAAVGDVGGARLLLIDDVITTGSSIREAARTLLAAGADCVSACALARVW